MGRRNRERVERVMAGDESGKVRHGIVGKTVGALQALSTKRQIEFLSESLRTGRLRPEALRSQLMANAYTEMRKGIKKLGREGRDITVDALLESYHSEVEFRELAEKVGLDEAFFVNVAKNEMRRWVEGIKWHG